MSLATERRAALPFPGRAGRSWAAWLPLAGMIAVVVPALLYLGRSTNFYFDEWDWIQGRRGWTLAALLEPHNEHLSLAPVLAFKTLFATFGISSYVPYRVLGLAVHCGVAVALWVYARRRVGELLALAAAASVLVLGSAWQDVLWPFQIGFLGSLLAGLGALLALDREDRRGDVLAAVLVGVALSSSSLGIAWLVAVGLEVLGRPDRRARWWIVAAPAVLYAVWWAVYGGAGSATLDNLFSAPGYVADAAAGAAGALFSLSVDWGRTLAVVLLGALLVSLHRRGHVSWRMAGLIVLPFAFWGLTAVARGGIADPASPRYLYPGGVFLLLVAVEAAAGVRLSRVATVAGAAIVAVALLGNVGAMRKGAGFLRDQSTSVNGALAALPLVASRVGPDFQPDPESAPQIRTGAYLSAVHDLGSPAPSVRELPGLYERARERADQMLGRALTPHLAGGAVKPSGAPPRIEGSQQATAATQGSCVVLTAQGGHATATAVIPAHGLVLRAVSGDVSVRLRRFADAFAGDPIGTLAPGAGQATLTIPADASAVPWRAGLTFGGGVRVCSAG